MYHGAEEIPWHRAEGEEGGRVRAFTDTHRRWLWARKFFGLVP